MAHQNQKSVQISCRIKSFPVLVNVTWYWADKDLNNKSLSTGQKWRLYQAELKNGVSIVRHIQYSTCKLIPIKLASPSNPTNG